MGIDIVSVIILLGILIFVHELGHFLAAKASGVGVLKFSLGFGPRLIGKKVGETEYRISAIPLGGYVRLFGESGDEGLLPGDEKRSFQKQPVLKRIGIVAAGPFFNFLFAFLVLILIFMAGIPELTSRVGDVPEGTPASRAGIRKGDLIVSIDGRPVSLWADIVEHVHGSKGRELAIAVRRDDREFRFSVLPEAMKSQNLFGEEVESYKIGIMASTETVTHREGPFRTVVSAGAYTWSMTKLTVLSVVKMIEGVVSPKNLGGPILIAQMAGTQVRQGILPFIFFMAILSINLGVLNLLPIPILDGGHLLFYIIELVTGKEVNIRWRERAQQVGFFLLILLMIFVFYNDIIRILTPSE